MELAVAAIQGMAETLKEVCSLVYKKAQQHQLQWNCAHFVFQSASL
jgi:hypothetical protein